MSHLGRGHAMAYFVVNLEKLGYDWAYRTIESLAYGLPQLRTRVFLLASRDHDPRAVLLSNRKTQPLEQRNRNSGVLFLSGAEGEDPTGVAGGGSFRCGHRLRA